MQESLFDDPPAAEPPAAKPVKKAAAKVGAAQHDQSMIGLAASLPPTLRMGGSTWSYPGWASLVWDREYSESMLSRHGLAAYAQHPLLRAVSLDRTFYKPLEAIRYAQYAAQVGDDFRFVVKAPGLLTDAMLRGEDGKGLRPNPYFLDVAHARQTFIEPLLQGLGHKLGAVVFQFSPLPLYWLERMPELISRLHDFLHALPTLGDVVADAIVAVEVRNAAWLTPPFTDALRATRTAYCLGLHAKMPRIGEQLPILRALWPSPLVCRWNLHPLHGAFGYETAAELYRPYDRLHDPDPETRQSLARVIAGVTDAGLNAFVTISNEAEGSAPLSVIELARAVRELKR